MLNQHVSMGDLDCAESASTALLPLPSRDLHSVVDPELNARILRAAAASDRPSPHVIPGAAVLLFGVDLPIKSDRKRRAAARFAAEPHLATSLDQTHVAVGPVLEGTTRLCAAIENNLHSDATVMVLPDLCAVPLPTKADRWSIWCGANAVYIRTSDGGGCVLGIDAFAEVFGTTGRPNLELWHGVPPANVPIAQRHKTPPPVDPSIFELDLRLENAATHERWRPHLKYAAIVAALGVFAHSAVLMADAKALERVTLQREAALVDHASTRSLFLDIDLPAQASAARLIQTTQSSGGVDPFLHLMGRAGDALAGTIGTTFRDLRYDASAGTLTFLINAPDLAALQIAEAALRNGGFRVTSGAASSSASGAEVQLTLSEAT